MTEERKVEVTIEDPEPPKAPEVEVDVTVKPDKEDDE